jgi:hypothetical protein
MTDYDNEIANHVERKVQKSRSKEEREFGLRCDKVIEALSIEALEYLDDKDVIRYHRVIGKIEGIYLAKAIDRMVKL